jgi:hypothetical protein
MGLDRGGQNSQLSGSPQALFDNLFYLGIGKEYRAGLEI